MRRLLRPICWLRGHRDAFWMLPEFFGLYRYSRFYCGRCELTFESSPPTEAEETAFWFSEAAAAEEAA